MVVLFSYLVVFLAIHHIWFWTKNNGFLSNIPGNLLISHRGYTNKCPENTIESFQKAVQEGFQWIELDIVGTKDGIAVCSHNFDLEKETNGIGYIDQTNYRMIRSCHCLLSNGLVTDSKIPSLEEVLDTLPNWVGLDVEVKTKSLFDLSSARATSRLISKLRLRPYLITSFNPIALLYFKLFYRVVPIGFLYQEKRMRWLANILHPDVILPRADLIDNSIIKFSKIKKLRLFTWTVNNISSIKYCFDNGVEGVITDIKVPK